MRLRDLKIENYGVFSGYELRFSPEGFELVYGPNEAGKSTLLQLIRELLFGFPHQNPYAFRWSSGEMAAEAGVEIADGRRIRFRRRKGHRAVVVGEVETTGEPIDEDDLARILGGASEELYRHVFGFSLTELSAGERSLHEAGLSKALYGGGVGGLANLQRVEETLLKRQQTLFKPTARKPPVNRLLAALREKTRELREAAVKPRDYDRLQVDRRRLEGEADELGRRLEALRRQSQRLERLETALRPWQRLVTLRRELQPLDVPDGFPAEGAEEFRRARSMLEELEDELSQLQDELGEKKDRLAALEPAPEVIAGEVAIRSLVQQVRQVQQFRRDIPLRLQESEAIRLEAQARLAELQPDWTLSQLEELQTSLAQREAVLTLADERSALRERQLSLEVRQPELRQRIAALRRRLDDLGPVEETTGLDVLVKQSTRYEVDRDRLSVLAREIERLEDEAQLLRPRVAAPLSQGASPVTVRPDADASVSRDLGMLEGLPVPPVAAVREFQERFGEASSDVRAAAKRLDDVRSELVKRREELGSLDARGTVPDRETLLLRRRTRDAVWRHIRRRYLSREGSTAEALASGEEPAELEDEAGAGLTEDPLSLPVRYEREVLHADALADERQAKAELVAQAEHLRGLVREQEERVREADQRVGRERSRAESLEREWKELWQPCGLDPLSPGAMLDWLRLHAELREKLAQLRSLKSRGRILEARLEEFSSELRAALSSVGVSARGSAEVLLAEACRRVELAAETARERERIEAELPADEERLEALDRELTATIEDTEAWRRRWRSLLKEFGFPASWEADLVVKILGGLALVREKVRDARSLDRRAAEMQAQTAEFEAEVTAVCKSVAPDLRELPAEAAVLELVERLDAAKGGELERKTLLRESQKTERRLATRREQRRRLEKTIEDLFRAAGAQSESEFQRVARAALERRRIVEEIDVLEREVRTIRGPEDEAAFLAELARVEGDAVASERQRLAEDIAAAEEARQDVLKEAGIARKRVTDLERRDTAPRLSLELESLRSELVESSDEWASLVVARTLITRALKRFEREHQPAMLREVTRLFEVMTLGQYVGVTRRLDERGTLLVEERGGDLKEPAELSRGTREQLYLAIRLAYVKKYCEESEPLPLVMDDVLVNFDDARARSTLKVLAEVARQVQILFLTCHESRISLAREVLPDLKPIVLPGGERATRRAEGAPWRESQETEERAGLFGRDGRLETRSGTGAGRRRAKREVPGRESSLRRRPGPLE